MIEVELVRAWPHRHESLRLRLPGGSTVGDALAAGGWQEAAEAVVAVYGVRAEAGKPLHDGDRIELLRPLLADPKEARRRRATGSGRGG